MQGYSKYRARGWKGVRRRCRAFEGISMIYDDIRQAQKRENPLLLRPHHYTKYLFHNVIIINPLYIKACGRLYV